MAEGKKRRLAAIMFTDIVGYSKFMVEDELHGRMLRRRHKEVFEKYTRAHNGQIIQYFGDGTLSVFESALEAVECAVNMQREFGLEPKVPLRIGIHLGDILYDETEAFGHGVNMASRIEPICNPGGILISDKVYDEIRNQSTISAKSLGRFRFRNMDQEIGIFAISTPGVSYPNPKEKAFMKEISQKMYFATIAERSDAFQQFLSENKINKSKKVFPWVLNISLILILALSLLFWKGNLGSAESSFAENPVSIAVLPFVNMNGTEENEYFSDGITEDILTLISKLNGFSVTSRTSIMQYKDTPKSMREIGKELNVSHLLEGSVRREGNKVRITAQLIDAEKDEHLWAKTYDEELTSIFDVQSNVAKDIAQQLRKNLSLDDREMMGNKPTENVAAYENYLKGRELYRKYTASQNDSAIAYFKKALDHDPDYSSAYAGLGDAFAQKAYRHGQEPKYLDSAEIMSKQAVKLGPKNSEAYKALGLVHQIQGNQDEALINYQKAIELDPYNDMASSNMGQIEIQKGNFLEGIKWAEHTFSINKNIPASSLNLAHLYYQLGEDEKSAKLVDEAIAINPNSPDLHEMKGQILLRQGNYRDARLEATKIIDLSPESPSGYALLGDVNMYQKNWQQAKNDIMKAKERVPEKDLTTRLSLEAANAVVDNHLGLREEAKEKWKDILEDLEKIDPELVKSYKGLDVFKGIVLSGLGKDQEALNLVEKAKKEHWINYKEGMEHPLFESLREIPEFEIIIKEVKAKADSLKRQLPVISP